MLWVGGHILISGVHKLGWHGPEDLVHHLEHAVHGGVQGWLVNTLVSAIVGLAVGAVVLGVVHVVQPLLPRRTRHDS
jgi:uncharacterized protein